MSQETFGNMFGISKSHVLKLEKGQRGVSVRLKKDIEEWIQNREQLERVIGTPHSNSKIAELYRIPVLGKVPAGMPMEVSEYTNEYIAVPGAPKDCFALRVHGESMEPNIRHDDYVLFVIDRESRPGDVVVVNDEFGDSMIKRLKEKDGEFFLVSDNPKFPTFKPNAHYRIMGVVIDAWRQLKF